MTDVIYSVSSLDEWIDVADKMETEHGWKPVYWMSMGDQEKITSTFSDVVFHPYWDATRGIPPKEYRDQNSYPIDHQLISDLLYSQTIAIKMMDRMDPGHMFNYTERFRHYHRLLEHWSTVLDEIGPDFVVFSSTPHVVTDYVLYSLCDRRDIDTIIFTPTRLPNRFYTRTTVEGVSPKLLETAEKTRGLSNIELESEIESYIQSLRSTSDEMEPDRMESHRDNQYIKIVKKLSNPLNWIQYLSKIYNSSLEVNPIRTRKQSYLKSRYSSLEESQITVGRYLLQRIRASYIKRQLKIEYQSFTDSVDYSQKYIYYPLHYQPERTTSPEGGLFVHQRLVVKLLSICIPQGWSLLVKEHPSQFFDSLYGERGRNKQFYHDIASSKNVTLVPLSESQTELIDNAEAVATITGTAGWEAIARQVPSIIFGNPWYRTCSGTFSIKSKEELESVINDLVEGSITIPKNTVRYFSQAILEVSEKGYLNQTTSTSTIGYEQNVQALYKSLCEYIN